MRKGFPFGFLVLKERMPASSTEPGGPRWKAEAGREVAWNSGSRGEKELKGTVAGTVFLMFTADVITEGTVGSAGWALAP